MTKYKRLTNEQLTEIKGGKPKKSNLPQNGARFLKNILIILPNG